jgi:hypothetical protein
MPLQKAKPAKMLAPIMSLAGWIARPGGSGSGPLPTNDKEERRVCAAIQSHQESFKSGRNGGLICDSAGD